MSNGSILISFDNNFSREHITNQNTGFLLPKNLSNNELCDKILEILKYPNSQRTSLNAYNYAKSNFSLERMSKL